jgi:hypothetical protein
VEKHKHDKLKDNSNYLELKREKTSSPQIKEHLDIKNAQRF